METLLQGDVRCAVRDGKLTSFQQFVDTAQLQDVMGAR